MASQVVAFQAAEAPFHEAEASAFPVVEAPHQEASLFLEEGPVGMDARRELGNAHPGDAVAACQEVACQEGAFQEGAFPEAVEEEEEAAEVVALTSCYTLHGPTYLLEKVLVVDCWLLRKEAQIDFCLGLSIALEVCVTYIGIPLVKVCTSLAFYRTALAS